MSDETSTNISRTDWKRLRAMGDEEIDLSEIPEMDEASMSRGFLRFDGKSLPENTVLVPIERDLVEQFEQRVEKGSFRDLINQTLRSALAPT